MVRVALVCLCLTGCSFAFVHGPPDNHRQLPVVGCTSSNAAPVLDTIFTVLELSNLGLASAQSDEQWANDFGGNPPLKRGNAMPFYAALSAVGAAGAYYGFTRVGACKAAQAEAVRRMTPPPPPGPPGATPLAPGSQQPLAEQGKAAAARDDCATALAIAQQLQADPPTYDAYVHDGGVAACFAKR